MLLEGVNHVAILTSDTERFVNFYREVFGAEVDGSQDIGGEGTLTFIKIGPHAEINLFELQDNAEAQRQTPMFGRGRIDHLGLQAASLDAFEEIRRRLESLVETLEIAMDRKLFNQIMAAADTLEEDLRLGKLHSLEDAFAEE